MAVNDLLSKEEINALLHNSSDDLISSSENASLDSEEEHLKRKISKEFPVLEMVSERFSDYLQSALSSLLGSNIEIILYGMRTLKFTDYTHSLFIPTSMNIVRISPLKNTGLFVFDPKLVFMLVDQYFGGEGRSFNIDEGRKFAPTELRVIEMILEKLLVTFKDAWSPITLLEPEFLSSEVNPQLTNVLSPDDIVIVVIFRVSMAGADGELHVTMPRSMLVSLQKLSESRDKQPD